MKTIPAALQTLIAKQVTTLSYMWKFTRRDGMILRFSDHDRPILFDEGTLVLPKDNIHLYEALSGFTRSTLAEKADLSVNNTDIAGLYSSDAITEEDLRKGLWDFAEFEIFLVDWAADPQPTTDKIILQRGFLGQVSLKDTQFQVEQRGLTQALAVVTGDVYSPLCRANLFDSECGLTASSWVQQSSVTSVTDRRQFVAESKKRVFSNRPFTEAAAVEVSIDADTGYATYDAATPDGTAEHPYQITTPAELNAIRNAPRAHYVLMNNINLGGWGNWTPIPCFQGNLDGRGFYIENIDLDDTSQSPQRDNGEWGWGFFAVIGNQGVVRNLGLKNVDVDPGVAPTSKTDLGAFFGSCVGLVEDCYVDGGNLYLNNNWYASGGFGGAVRRLSWWSWNDALTPTAGTEWGIVRRCWCKITLRWSALYSANSGFIGWVDTEARPHQVGCYFDKTVAGTDWTGSQGDQATPLTTAEMKQAANFPEFDFVNVWVNGAGADYHRHLDPGYGNGTDEAWLRFEGELLTKAGTYSSSIILWSADEPGSSAITVDASRDGDTWSACTNGATIPGFTPSEDLTGDYLFIRVNFVESGTDYPTLEGLTFTVTGQADAFDANALGDDDWFKEGHLRWLSGLNEGISMEVKSWNGTTRELVLFLEMPFDIVAGDQFNIYPGCTKRIIEDCKTKFSNVENFRGEPNVPGTDHLYHVPDAQT